ncbi:hypothetical protein cce_3036 [Crocosphaera subtropica ATCC 51142]|uniref:Ice-binding protein C-terminal domain-containing protein n=1 Tax=Crocosphaera subtropica (strain ATCC 51142 / BH68) TaxID=43989 RepID=B1WW51_CROS5|nr:PPC domain-containing protein [Crocosphaera subtropica]ACB52384.1 hypothetical protein cce_3036 [Crocosphaera subtropica ATCC 51142]
MQKIAQTLTFVATGVALLGLGTLEVKPAQALSLFGESFAGSYSSLGLGQVPGVPNPYGGITFLPDDPNTLLITGRSDFPDATAYSIGVLRDSNNRITGFSGEATVVTTVPGIGGEGRPNAEFAGADGGLTFGPNNVLFYTTFDNTLGQVLPGSSTPDKLVDLTGLGVEISTGALRFVPAGFPGEGRLKIGSYNGSTIYDTTVSPDGSGTFNIATPGSSVHLGGPEETFVGPEAFIYVDEEKPGFEGPSLLVAQWGQGFGVTAYEVDGNGDPIIDTARQFLNWPKFKSGGPEGMIIDPLTGDILMTTYIETEGLGSQVLRVSATPSTPATPDMNPFDPIAFLDLSSGVGSASGAVSTGNEVFAFEAKAGELLTFGVEVSDILSGTGYKDDDSVLYLYNSAGDVLAVGDDSPDSFESRVLNFLVPEDDTYYAAITTFGNEPILELGPVNTILGFEEDGLSNIVYDLTINRETLPETARLFDIALAVAPDNPVGSTLIDGDRVLFVDLNGTRNTDLTGPLQLFINADENTITFDNFEFILEFAEPFPSTDINDILDLFTTSEITAIIPPDELIQDIVFTERLLPSPNQPMPGQSVPEPASVLGLLSLGALGVGSKLKRK